MNDPEYATFIAEDLYDEILKKNHNSLAQMLDKLRILKSYSFNKFTINAIQEINDNQFIINVLCRSKENGFRSTAETHFYDLDFKVSFDFEKNNILFYSGPNYELSEKNIKTEFANTFFAELTKGL
ncbi:hypothetical protein [Arcticibacterium luteifluviistationis]|nr:hypothetical protein [Arcticibacterium luteifluviistationis]